MEALPLQESQDAIGCGPANCQKVGHRNGDVNPPPIGQEERPDKCDRYAVCEKLLLVHPEAFAECAGRLTSDLTHDDEGDKYPEKPTPVRGREVKRLQVQRGLGDGRLDGALPGVCRRAGLFPLWVRQCECAGQVQEQKREEIRNEKRRGAPVRNENEFHQI